MFDPQSTINSRAARTPRSTVLVRVPPLRRLSSRSTSMAESESATKRQNIGPVENNTVAASSCFLPGKSNSTNNKIEEAEMRARNATPKFDFPASAASFAASGVATSTASSAEGSSPSTRKKRRRGRPPKKTKVAPSSLPIDSATKPVEKRARGRPKAEPGSKIRDGAVDAAGYGLVDLEKLVRRDDNFKQRLDFANMKVDDIKWVFATASARYSPPLSWRHHVDDVKAFFRYDAAKQHQIVELRKPPPSETDGREIRQRRKCSRHA